MEILAPDFEVIVRVNASDVVVASGFITGEDTFDVLVGVTATTSVPFYQKLLGIIGAALDSADWQSLDDMGIPDGDEEDADGAIPF